MRKLIRNLIIAPLAIVLVTVASGCFGTSNPAAPSASGASPGSRNIAFPIETQADADEPPKIRPNFENSALARGIEFQFFNDIQPKRYFLPEIMGGGAGWLDYDLDGWMDAYLPNGGHLVPTSDEQPVHNGLFRNLNGQFENVAASAFAEGNAAYGQGCAVGDYNADGFPDVFVSNYGPDLLLLNNGDGTFSDVSETSGINDGQWGSSSLWTDLNEDGLLDLYLSTYTDTTIENTPKKRVYDGVVGYSGPGDFNALDDKVYLNQGDGSFKESSTVLGMTGKEGKGLAVVAMDFDGDGQVEVYVANDMAANFMFTRSEIEDVVRDPQTPWHDVAVEVGCAVAENGDNEASMGISCADFDGDGRPDIFLTHFANSKSTLYRNRGEMFFEDFSEDSRIARISHKTLGFGTVAFDYDRNGAADIFVTNGNVLGAAVDPSEMPPQLFINDGRGRFRDASKYAGPYFQDKYLGRGAAGCDFDNDGDIDILVTHVVKPYALLENQTETNGTWIGFDAVRLGRACTHGAVVTVAAGGESSSAQFTAGGSYLSSPDSRVLLTAPNNAKLVEVSIRWPDGTTTDVGTLRTGKYWRIMENQAPIEL